MNNTNLVIGMCIYYKNNASKQSIIFKTPNS